MFSFVQLRPDSCAGNDNSVCKGHIDNRYQTITVPSRNLLSLGIEDKDLGNTYATVVLTFSDNIVIIGEDLEDDINGPGGISPCDLFLNTIHVRARTLRSSASTEET